MGLRRRRCPDRDEGGLQAEVSGNNSVTSTGWSTAATDSKAIRGVCRQFVVLCKQLGLFRKNLVAIDSRKLKAVNNRDCSFTSDKLKRQMEEIEPSIQ